MCICECVFQDWESGEWGIEIDRMPFAEVMENSGAASYPL